jgi:hypothetical protein
MTLLKVIALAISLAAPSSAALAASAPLYWTYGSRKQDEVARVQNKGGLSVLISCGSGNESRNADIVIDLPDANIKKGTALTAQVVVSGKSLPFALSTEFAPHFLNVVRSASTNSEIQTLALGLSASADRSFSIAFPEIKRVEAFSLLNAKDTILGSNGQLVTAPCNL